MVVGHQLLSFFDHCFWNLHQEWKKVWGYLKSATKREGGPTSGLNLLCSSLPLYWKIGGCLELKNDRYLGY